MLRRPVHLMSAALAALFVPALVQAGQFPSELVGFETGCVDAPACKEIFRAPNTSGSTQGIVANVVGEDNNGAFRVSSTVGAPPSEGSVAYQVFFKWVVAADPNAWVRLTTLSTTDRPNPSLDTRGKVRFKIQNIGEFGTGAVGLCIGIRETGADVPQLSDGGTNGPIEWVGVDPTINAIAEPHTGGNGTADTTAHVDDEQIIPVGQPATPGAVVIGPGPDGDIDTVILGSDDFARFGYFLDAEGERVPVPVVTVAPAFGFLTFEVDMTPGATQGDVTFNGTTYDGAVVGFSGNGVLDAPNDRGTLEHLAITNVVTDPATDMLFYLDELQFEATVPDPVLPPSVAFPIVNGDISVTVNNIVATADEVRLFRDAVEVTPSIDPAGAASVVFDISAAPAMTGEVFTATQRVGAVESDPSVAVEVLSAAPPYTFSTIIDETGSGSCNTAAPGWEWVGVTSVIAGSVGGSFAPQGMTVLTDDARWQTIDLPLDDDNLILSTSGIVGGDGTLGPSPTGKYTLDSLWFTSAPGNAAGGPWEVFIDAVSYLDSMGIEQPALMSMEDGVNRLPQNRGQSPVTTTSTAISALTAYDGSNSHRLAWTYSDPVDNTDSMGILQRLGSCGSSIEVPDTATDIRFHMVLRAQPTNPGVALPTVVGPIVVGSQTDVRVLCAATATNVKLFVDGAEVRSEAVSAVPFFDFTGLSLTPGQSVSAKQTIGTESDFAYPKNVQNKPFPPIVASPILPQSTAVTVSGLLTAPFATASTVTVYINTVAQTPVATGGAASVNVTVPALALNSVVKAIQTVNGAPSNFSNEVTVSVPSTVIYYPPAQGDETVRVTGVSDLATQVKIVNTTTLAEHTLDLTPGPGNRTVDVPVTGLTAGDVIVARQTASGLESGNSVAETVTVDAVIQTIWCDTFEYADQAAFNAWWTAVAPSSQLILSTSRNATVGGAKSMSAPAAPPNYRSSRGLTLPTATPTDMNPVVWNVTILDPTGAPGPLQYADLNNNAASAQLCEIGMTNLGPGGTQTHYQGRIVGNGGPNWIHLNQFDGPTRSVGFHVFTMVFKGPKAGNAAGHEVDMYVDGKLGAKNVLMTSNAITLREPRLGTSFATPAGGYYDDYCAEVGPVRFNEVTPQPPNPPVFTLPVKDGDLSVHLTGIATNSTLVEVFVAGNPTAIGSLNPAGATEVDVPVTELQHLQLVTAIATNAAGPSLASLAWEVGKGNGDILLTLGVRDSGDTAALGTPGSTSAAIEWIGATAVTSNAPQGMPISPSANWQTVTFNPTGGTIFAFPGSGNGVLNFTRGTIEHLAVTMNAASAGRSSGKYVIYIDNVVNVGAGAGGSDFVITDFEGATAGSEVLFQEPTFSGTTSANMAPLPSSSENSTAQANGGLASQKLEMFFRDTAASRYARITTSGAATTPSPIIDLTRPIRMDVLLLDDTVTTGACCLPAAACEDGHTAATCVGYVCDTAALYPPGYLGCYGDLDANNVVNPADRGFVSANINATVFDNVCKFDMDGNGVVNPADRGFVSANIGGCQPLPDFMNGSGLNDGLPEDRFGNGVFQGIGSSCSGVTCP